MRRPPGTGYTRPNGYIVIGAKGHPVARAGGKAYMHRVVLYDKIGPGVHACYHCDGLVEWFNQDNPLWVDHLDWTKTNNDPDNLVPSCKDCNSRRWKERDDRGERNPYAKLTDLQVQQIRSATGRQVDIAAAFGVSQSHVSALRSPGRTIR